MEAHPLARKVPALSPEKYAELKESLRTNGYLEHLGRVVIHEGKVLDGVHRSRACGELGIKALVEKYAGDDPEGFVAAANIHRRHLDPSQEAMAAAELSRLRRGGDRRSQDFKGGKSPLKIADVAKAHSVDATTIKAARVVLEKGSPELVRAVRNGNIAVSAARALVSLPRRDQVAIASEKDDRERAKLIKAAKDSARREPRPEPPPAVELTHTKEKTKKRYYSVREWEQLSKEARDRIVADGFEAEAEKMNEQTGTSIEWARWSHNTVTGCLHDCPYCYARDIAERLYPQKFAPTFHPSRLAGPGSVEVPDAARKDESYRNVFANSMSDLFGQWVPGEWIEATIEMAVRNPKWNFLTLTKFPQRAAEFEFPQNWWMGTTVDAQARVENAEKAFAKVKCGTKWLSLEPLLEPLEFKRLDLFQWVVIGGASESKKTPAFVPPWRWLTQLQAQADAAGCRVYHKTNLPIGDALRLREFPWVTPEEFKRPKPFNYLKGMS